MHIVFLGRRLETYKDNFRNAVENNDFINGLISSEIFWFYE